DPPEQIFERRATVGGETHHLVLTLVHGKAEIGGEGRVEHSQRVREAQLAGDFDSRLPVVVDLAAAERQRRPLAHAIGGEYRGALYRSREERGRGVGLVMLAEQDPVRADAEPRGDDPLDPELAAQRVLHGAGKAAPGAGEAAQGHGQDAIELQHRLFVEDHRVELLGFEVLLLEAPLDRGEGKRGVVLAAREPLLLDGADRHAVDQQRRRGIVVVRRDAEDAHQYWLFIGTGRRAGAKPTGSDRAERFASSANGGSNRKYCSKSSRRPSIPATADARRR